MAAKAFNSIPPFFIAVLLASNAQALSPPPPQPDEELFPLLYETLDGDTWHRNDGWLDPDVHWCDWYGVDCADEFWGSREFRVLGLAQNNLAGELTEDLAENLLGRYSPMSLDLSGNRISGKLSRFPRLVSINLADNQLAGPLPEFDLNVHPWIWHMQLAGNQFEGNIPESWSEISLFLLDLSDNAIEGSVEPALAALNTEKLHLWLADNPLEGTLDPDWFADREFESINLCWTNLTIEDEAFDEWLAEHHLGGPHHACLGRQRHPLDPSLSGSWYDPARDGEGFALILLDNGAPLIYWFTHTSQARQMWQFAVGDTGEYTFRFRTMLETRGSFDSGFLPVDHPVVRAGQWRLDRVEDELLHGEHLTFEDSQVSNDMNFTWPLMPDSATRRDYQRLTRLAGTTCDNQSPYQSYSGAWYNPENNGEGFIIEALPDDRGLVYWFTYTADGSGEQAWMTGDGAFGFSGFPGVISPPAYDPLVIESLSQPVSSTHGPDFDPADVERIDWGKLEIRFHDDNSGHVYFDSKLEGFGSGDYPIERLARPMLAECE